MDVLLEIPVIPIGAPRMTQRDRWKKRPVVLRYFDYKDTVRLSGFKVTETLNVIFYMQMPKSWSAKKKAAMDGKPHDQKPDIDNLLKALMDTTGEDKTVHTITARKIWSSNPRITILK